MSCVLFIANFDTITKSISSSMPDDINLQLCPFEPEMTARYVSVVEITAVLISLLGIRSEKVGTLGMTIEKLVSKRVPILIIGSDEECDYFDTLFYSAQAKRIAKAEVVSAVYEEIKGVSLRDKAEQKANTYISEPEKEDKKIVLLVDDDGRMLRSMKLILDNDYKVNVANSGMAALTSIGRERPDLILLDYEMPVCDGKMTLEMLRANEETKDIPVFFLTSVSEKKRIIEVLQLGTQGYILKGSYSSSILNTIANFFSRKGN